MKAPVRGGASDCLVWHDATITSGDEPTLPQQRPCRPPPPSAAAPPGTTYGKRSTPPHATGVREALDQRQPVLVAYAEARAAAMCYRSQRRMARDLPPGVAAGAVALGAASVKSEPARDVIFSGGATSTSGGDTEAVGVRSRRARGGGGGGVAAVAVSPHLLPPAGVALQAAPQPGGAPASGAHRPTTLAQMMGFDDAT